MAPFPSCGWKGVRSGLVEGWNSGRMRAVRFYGGYLQGPLLFVLGAVAVEKAIYYGVMPLSSRVAREADYRWAQIELKRNDPASARLSIRAALLRSRDDARLWRTAAEISARLDSPETTYCWQQLDRLQPGVAETELTLAESALRYGQLDLAAAALQSVAERSGLRYETDAGRLAQAAGQPGEARLFFEQVAAADPKDAATRLILARWQAESDDPAERAAARRTAAELLATAGAADRVELLLLLLRVERRAGDWGAARKWSDTLLAQPTATLPARLEALSLQTSPALRQSQLEKVMASARTDAEVAQVTDWLAGHGGAARALQWIRSLPASRQDDPELGSPRAECLAALGCWEHLREVQAAVRWPGREPERLMLLSRACFELQAEADGRAAWGQALEACRGYGDFMVLLHGLESWPTDRNFGAIRDEARAETWVALAVHVPGEAWPLEALVSRARARQDAAEVEKWESPLAALEPGNVAAGADLDRLRRLRGEETGDAELDRLARLDPANPAVATALAFRSYRQGDFSSALATLGALAPGELNAPERAVYLGALLAVAGPTAQARAHLEAARKYPGLLDEEQKLLARADEAVAYRETMADLLHGPEAAAARARQTLEFRAGAGSAIFRVGAAVAQAKAGEKEEAVSTLAQVEPGELDAAGRMIYLGGVLYLAGAEEATHRLELGADVSPATPRSQAHAILEAWWNLAAQEPAEPGPVAGLFAAYRGLAAVEPEAAFWRRDAGREQALVRGALLHGWNVDAAQERLVDLLKRAPLSPGLEAQLAYSFLLQGRPEAAQERIELLPRETLLEPGSALYYGMILAACGEKKSARAYLDRAVAQTLEPEERALARQAEGSL